MNAHEKSFTFSVTMLSHLLFKLLQIGNWK